MSRLTVLGVFLPAAASTEDLELRVSWAEAPLFAPGCCQVALRRYDVFPQLALDSHIMIHKAMSGNCSPVAKTNAEYWFAGLPDFAGSS